MMKEYLFLITIGPVQSFIAQARKAQDLFAGSKLLSDLIRISIQKFVGMSDRSNANFEIIFPSNYSEPNASLPNRFVGKISAKESINIEGIGKIIEKAIQEKFIEIGQNTIEGKKGNKGVFTVQLKRHLDIHWVGAPIETSYEESYKQLEKDLGAIKNLRTFDQLNSGKGEQGRKCSLDGMNNAIFYRSTNPKTKQGMPALMYLNEEPELVNEFILNPGEALSAVSYVKRKYNTQGSFSSVAEIALKEAIIQLKNDSCLKDLKTLCSGTSSFIQLCLKKGEELKIEEGEVINNHFDYQMVFPENITEKEFPNETQRRVARKISKKLEQDLADKHYGLIMFDGDKIGKWLSGHFCSLEAGGLEQFHKEFSRLLSQYAKEARLVLANKGEVIYAGGDDFMGMVNLHHLFDVMSELRKKFDILVNQKIGKKKDAAPPFTFSAGIVIAHYKIPLSEVLKKARYLEKKAKKQGERNAFSVAVLKHSGDVQEATFKWDANPAEPSNASNWNHLFEIFEGLRKRHFSSAFIQNISATIVMLSGSLESDLEDIDPIQLKPEFKRIIDRAFLPSSGIDRKKEVERLTHTLYSLIENSRNPKRLQNFVHGLHIVDFLNRRLKKF